MFQNLICKENLSKQNDITKFTSCILILMIITIVFIRGFNTLADWDAINYIANGISLWHEGKPIVTYPGTLFSLLTVFLAEHILGGTQFSNFVYLAIIPLCITIIFSYKICRIYVTRTYSICILATIFMFFDYDCGISYMLLQAYSDGWLLMFFTIAGYTSLKDRYILAAMTMAIAYFFRSQAFILALFIPILFQNKSFIKIVKYFFVFLITILTINFLIHYIIPTQNEGELNFYVNWLNAFSAYKNLTSEQVIEHLKFLLIHFKKSLFLIIFSIILTFIAMNKTRNYAFKKIVIFGLSIFLFQLLSIIHLMFIGVKLSAGENRYFIYSALFCTLAAFLALSEYCQLNCKIKKLFLFFVFILFIGRFSFAIYSIKNLDKRFYEHDFDNSNIPILPKNSNIGVVGYIGQGILYNIFKNQRWIGDYSFSCKELMSNANKFEYVFIADPKVCVEERLKNIIYEKNVKYEKIWESKKPYREYILFKKFELTK